MSNTKLNEKESEVAKKVLDIFAYREYLQRGYKWINGAFSHAEVEEVNEDFVYFKLKIGAQDGASDSVSTEHYQIARNKLLWKIPVEEKINLIEER